MSGGYNLRSAARKRNLTCYLQDKLEPPKSSIVYPKVCLTRSPILEKYVDNSFYVKNDQIIPILRANENINHEKNFWKFVCIIIIITTSLIYWKDNFSEYGNSVLKKSAFIQSTFRNYQIEAFKYFAKAGLNRIENKEEIVKIHTPTSEISDEIDVDPVEIRKLVREYLLEQKRKNTPQSHKSFINDQCLKDSQEVPEPFEVYTKNSTSLKSDLYDLTDYALESKGATVVSVYNTEPYGLPTLKFWNFDFGNFGNVLNFFIEKYINFNGPSSVLKPWKKPGDCWAFKGSHGQIEIKLSEKIVVDAIAIEHITQDLSPDGIINSAPKKFSVDGLQEAGHESSKTNLGTYEYKIKGPSSQIFEIRPQVSKNFEAVKVTILSNHGNEDYTCIYKICIHGHK